MNWKSVKYQKENQLTTTQEYSPFEFLIIIFFVGILQHTYPSFIKLPDELNALDKIFYGSQYCQVKH